MVLELWLEALGPYWAKFPAPTLALPNLQTKHINFNTNINIKEIHIENVKTNLPKKNK